LKALIFWWVEAKEHTGERPSNKDEEKKKTKDNDPPFFSQSGTV